MIAVIAIFLQVSIRRNSPRLLLAAVLLSPLWLLDAGEGGGVTLSLGRIQVADWVAEGVKLELSLADGGDRFQLSAALLSHPSLPEPLRSLSLKCSDGRLTERQVECRRGQLKLRHQALEVSDIPLSFYWSKSTQQIDLKINSATIFGGKSSATLALREGRWQIDLDAMGVDLQAVGKVIGPLETLRNEYNITGAIDLKATLSGSGKGLHKGRWKGRFQNIGFSYQDENWIGEELAGGWSGSFAHQNESWSGDQLLSLASGAALTPHFFISPEGGPLSFRSDFTFSPAEDLLKLPKFEFNHPEILSFQGSGEFSPGGEEKLRLLNIRSDDASVSALFSAYLEPVLVDPFFTDLELAGELAVVLNIRPGGEVKASLHLKEIFIEQGDGSEGQYALYGVNGALNWAQQGAVEESRLSWRGGQLFGGIDLGASALNLLLEGRRLELAAPAAVPVLDGSMRIEDFYFEARDEGPEVRFSGYLTPLSMEKFSQAVGWPVLTGELSGMIPGISYSAGVIRVDGMVLIRVFDGKVLLRNLVLDELFGVLPGVSADIEFKNLDLEMLTGTFSFGKITGRLEGEVEQMRLEDWRPVSFDAWLATPVDDNSRHRISQKAVDSISNLGGSGVSGALSRSFMRFFDEFSYDRLGVRCTLENGICEMSGVEKADRGYYLVKGGGIPRIDILGFNRHTDWNILLSKLQQIATGGAPVVE